MNDEARYLRRLYCISVGVRFSLGIGGWLLMQVAEIPLLQDSLYYEEVGANIARDWLSGRPSTWLETIGRQPYQPVLMVTVIACFYVLTLGVRALPLLLAFYSALTAFAPVLTYHIARQIGASASAARLSGWLVAISPAFVFWCGALYKEGLVLLILNLSIYHTLQLQSRWQTKSFCILSLCLLSLCALRLYLALIMAPTACLGLLNGRAENVGPTGASRALMIRPLVVALFVLVVIAVGFAAHVQEILPTDLQEGLCQIQSSHDDLARAPSGYLQEANISTARGAAQLIPLGVAHFLTVPLPWQTGSLRQNLAIPDTTVWLLLYPMILIGMARAAGRNLRGSLLLIAPTVGLCLLYALLIGNIGTAYRLRVQVWLLWAPFLGLGWEALRPRRATCCRPRDGDAWAK